MLEAYIPKKEIESRMSKDFEKKLLDKKIKLDGTLREDAKIKAENYDISTQDEIKAELDIYEVNSSFDRLTYLRNRNYLFQKGVEFFDEFENPEKKHKSLSVISLDVDFFKAYNEVSHTFGDVALQLIGQVLRQHTDGGFSIRLGGEEIFLVVEMDSKEIAAKAEKIKEEIAIKLNSLISEADTWDEKPAGTTRDYLERKILTENRSRESFDKQMKLSEEYQTALDEIKDIYNLTEIFGLENVNQLPPSDFVLFLKDQLKSPNLEPQNKMKLEKIYKEIPFQVGTATFSAVEVKFDPEKPSVVSAKDNEDIKLYCQLEGLDDKIIEKINFVDEKYQDVYSEISRLIGGDEKKARKIIMKIKEARFGRIVDVANQLADKQKKNRRDQVMSRTYDLAQIDANDIEDLKDKKDGVVVSEETREAYKDIFNELNAKLDSSKEFVADKLYEKYLEFLNNKIFHNAKEEQTFKESLLEIQKLRYYDGLTKTKNYDYLTSIVPRELQKAKDANQDYSVISFDMDNLKAVNETGGHKLGDAALMAISLKFQNILENLNKKPTNGEKELIKKIEATKIKPSLIRNGGGEEFIITLPGLNSHEAHEIFVLMRDQVTKELKELYQSVGKKQEIIDYLAGPLKYNGKNLEKFGTLTAGVVSLSDESKYNLGVIDKEGKINAGKMRELADKIGERLKKEKLGENESGRGHMWAFETYRLIEKLDEVLNKNKMLNVEVQLLDHERHELRQELAKFRAELKTTKDTKRITELRERYAILTKE